MRGCLRSYVCPDSESRNLYSKTGAMKTGIESVIGSKDTSTVRTLRTGFCAIISNCIRMTEPSQRGFYRFSGGRRCEGRRWGERDESASFESLPTAAAAGAVTDIPGEDVSTPP